MSDVHNRIVQILIDSFIVDRAIDPMRVARAIQREFPQMTLVDLADAVRSVANGIGVRVEEYPDEASRAKAPYSSCV
jgi:hypothetical protein